MKKIDYDLFRSRLESEQEHLTQELEQLMSSGRQTEDRRDGSPFGKREEEATESFELEKRLALEKGLRNRLAEIEHALQEIEAGTYGRCESCGKPIDPDRLEALPQATLCMNCKAAQAKNAKGK
ncbi:MAG: TraR/DksA C4-type zinc finger protein [Chloroflexota bacterium]